METSFDIDQTQAIALDDFEEEDRTDELEPDEEKKPVAHLKVLLQKGLTETTFPLYEGDNVVGRDATTCHVCIPSKSLSKEHACIQIIGDSHLIYDKGSRNKTRRGKLYLSPDVRYELKHENEITFADVKCVYQIQRLIDTVAESGSDTDGSDSLLLKYNVTGDSDTSGVIKNGHNLADDENCVILSTQTGSGGKGESSVIANDTPEAQRTSSNIQGAGPVQTLVLSESESEEEDSARGKGRKQKSIIQETLLCEDSDPEASRDREALGAATQAYVIHSDDEDSLKEDIIGAPTQVYGDITVEVEEEEAAANDTLLCEPTQAFVQPPRSGRSNGGQQKLSPRASSQPSGTQSFDVSGKSTKEGTQVFDKNENKSSAQNDSADSSTRATQVFDEEEDDEDIDATGLFAVSTMACDLGMDVDDEEDDDEVVTVDEPTQVFDVAGSGAKGKKDENANSETVVIEADATVPVHTTEKSTKRKTGKKQNTPSAADAPTQLVSDTVAVPATNASPVKDKTKSSDSSNLPTQVFDETLPVQSERKVWNHDSDAPTVAVDSTLPVTEVSQKAGPARRGRGRGRRKGAINETAVSNTVVLDEEEAEVSLDEPTQAYDTSPARKGRGRRTQQDTETLQISDTVVIDKEDNADQDEPTQAYSTTPAKRGRGKSRRTNVDADVQISDTVVVDEEEEPTQAYGTTPVKRGRGRRTQPEAEAATVQITDTVVIDEEEDSDQDEPTQAYRKTPTKRGRGRGRGRGRSSQRTAHAPTLVISDTVAIIDNDGDVEPTQAFEVGPGGIKEAKGKTSTETSPVYKGTSDEPTQAYGIEDSEATKSPSSRKSPLQIKRGSQHEMSDDEDADGDKPWLEKAGEQPTQAYGVPDEGATQPYGVDDDDGNSDVVAIGAEEPTQAYGLGIDDDADATQAYEDDEGDTSEDNRRIGNEDPTQKYDVVIDEADLNKTASDVAHRQDDSAEHKKKEEMDDDSDSDEESMLKIDPNAADEQAQLLAAGEDEGKSPEPTLAYDIAVEDKPRKGSKAAEPTLAYDIAVEDKPRKGSKAAEPTLAYDIAVEDKPRKGSKAAEPTLAYDIAVEDKPRKGSKAAEPALAYDIAVEEEPRKMSRGRPAKGKAKKGAASPSREISPEVSRQDGQTASGKSITRAAAGPKDTPEQLSDTEEMVPDSMDDTPETDARPPVIRLPSRSPLKSNLVDRKRSPSPAPKHVAFAELPTEKEEEGSQVSTRRGGRSRESPSKHSDKSGALVSSLTRRGRSQLKETSDQTEKNADDEKTVSSPSRMSALRKAGAGDEAVTSSTDVVVPGKEAENQESTTADTDTASPVKVRQGRSSTKQSSNIISDKEAAKTVDAQSSKVSMGSGKISSTPSEKQNQEKVVEKTEANKSKNVQDGEAVQPVAKRGRRSVATKAESEVNTEVQTTEKRTTKRGAVEQPKTAASSSRKKAKVSGTTEVIAEKAADGNDTDETASIASSVADSDQKDEVVKEDDKEPESRRGGRVTRGKMEKDDKGGRASRVSSRGRKISNNSFLKDFETSGPTGKRGRSSSVTSKEDNEHTDVQAGNQTITETGVSDVGDEKKGGKSSKVKEGDDSKTGGSMGPPATIRGRSRQQKAQLGSQDEAQSGTDDPVTSTGDNGSEEKVDAVKNNQSKKEDVTNSPSVEKRSRGGRKRGRKASESEERMNESTPMTADNSQAESQGGSSGTEPGVQGRGRRGRASAATADLSQTSNTSIQSASQDSSGSEKSEKLTPKQTNKTGGRGRKSVVSQASSKDDSHTEMEDSQGSTRSSRRAGGNSEISVSQESSQASATKRGAKTLSQPSPSPAKRAKLPSSPHTPFRKTETDAAALHSPALRKSTLEHKPKVMFTGVIDEHGEKTVKELGGEMASNIQECTHLVTDKVRRTVKFLSGLAKGIYIVSPQWLESCKQAGTFLDGSKFLVSDPPMEKQYKFSLATSISKAAHSPVLTGYRVHVSKSVRPDPAQMQDILLCAGAEYVKTMPSKFQENTIVISCADDQKICQPAIKAGVPVVEAEFILTGILRQEVDTNAFALFRQDEPSSQAAKKKGRKK